MLSKKKVLKSQISKCSYSAALNEIVRLSKELESSYVCLVNVHMLIESWDNPRFLAIVNSADLALPDGGPVAASMTYLYKEAQSRIAGMDLIEDLMRKIEKEKQTIFLYGSTEEALEKIKAKSKLDYPNLKLFSYSPPFRLLTDTEKKDIINKINAVTPDYVFVALGCPKQERWMAEHKGVINSCMLGLGGAFSTYAEDIIRSPLWMRKNNLEWLYRLYKEPRRLWKRYLYTNAKFIFLIIIQYIKVKFHSIFKKL